MTTICERLHRKSCLHWPSDPCWKSCQVNPDGPEAATLIDQAVEALTEARDCVGGGTFDQVRRARAKIDATLASLQGTAK